MAIAFGTKVYRIAAGQKCSQTYRHCKDLMDIGSKFLKPQNMPPLPTIGSSDLLKLWNLTLDVWDRTCSNLKATGDCVPESLAKYRSRCVPRDVMPLNQLGPYSVLLARLEESQ